MGKRRAKKGTYSARDIFKLSVCGVDKFNSGLRSGSGRLAEAGQGKRWLVEKRGKRGYDKLINGSTVSLLQ